MATKSDRDAALNALLRRVDAGEEFPDAEERVAREYRLSDSEVRAMRNAYDVWNASLPAGRRLV
ncbi:MAG: hypothetical protein ACYDDA_15705 [Acidiferrobacteraceae bacterium]